MRSSMTRLTAWVLAPLPRLVSNVTSKYKLCASIGGAAQTRRWRVIAPRQADGPSIDQSGEIRVLPFFESGGYRVFIGRIFAASDLFDGEDDAGSDGEVPESASP